MVPDAGLAKLVCLGQAPYNSCCCEYHIIHSSSTLPSSLWLTRCYRSPYFLRKTFFVFFTQFNYLQKISANAIFLRLNNIPHIYSISSSTYQQAKYLPLTPLVLLSIYANLSPPTIELINPTLIY